MTAVVAHQFPAPLDDRADAVVQVMTGSIVGASFGSVFTLIGDGLSPSLGDDMVALTGRARTDRSQAAGLSICIPADRIAGIIDTTQVHPAVRDWAVRENGLIRAFGSQCILRVPIRPAVAIALPRHLISVLDRVPYVQVLDPSGVPGAGAFIADLWESGVFVPAVTSMRVAGTREITDLADAVDFARMVGLHSLVTGPLSDRRGPLTIVEVGPRGVSVARAGTFPAAVVEMVARHAGQPDERIDSRRQLPY